MAVAMMTFVMDGRSVNSGPGWHPLLYTRTQMNGVPVEKLRNARHALEDNGKSGFRIDLLFIF